MPGKSYSRAERAGAVALARTMGATLASQQLGIPSKSIRRWQEAAGDDPSEMDVSPVEWSSLQREALDRTQQWVRSGKMSAAALATVAAIAARNARFDPKPTEDLDDDKAHLERIRKEHGQPGVDFLTSCIRLSLRRQRIGGDPDGPSSPEIVAAVDDWELGCIRIALEDHGDLVTAKAAVDAELDRLAVLDAIALDEQLARNAESRARWETESLIRRAEAYLAQPQPEARA